MFEALGGILGRILGLPLFFGFLFNFAGFFKAGVIFGFFIFVISAIVNHSQLKRDYENALTKPKTLKDGAI